MNRRKAFALVVMAILGLLICLHWTCSNRPSLEPIELTPPLVRIRTHGGKEYFLKIRNDSKVENHCDLELLAGLRPGMTSSEVAKILGPSQGRSEEYGRDDVFSFFTDRGTVDVVRQPALDSEGEAHGSRWLLRARPNDGRLAEHLSSEVLAALLAAKPGDSYSLVIYNHSSSAKVVIQGTRVLSIWWLRDEPFEEPKQFQ